MSVSFLPAGPDSGVSRTVLPGGLRVVTEHVPGVRSASVGCGSGRFSRRGARRWRAPAHFLEHLLFKSTPSRSALDIAQVVDSIGGELNAFTTNEHTCYYAHVLDDDLPLAVDLVADVVLNGQCRSGDVELDARWCSRRSRCATTTPRISSVTRS